MDIVTLLSNKLPHVKQWVERTLPFVGKAMNARRTRMRTEAYKKYGLETAARFDQCMTECGYRYMLIGGTMLGAIREHGFIKHDMDLDVSMWIDDYSPKMIGDLKRYGFEWLYSYQIADGKYGREDTFDYKGCRIDIFYIYPAVDKLPYITDYWNEPGMAPGTYMPRRQEIPFVRETRLEKFEDLMLPVPANAEEQCIFRYGEDYMTPNPRWDNHKKVSCILDWEEMVGQTRHLTYPKI